MASGKRTHRGCVRMTGLAVLPGSLLSFWLPEDLPPEDAHMFNIQLDEGFNVRRSAADCYRYLLDFSTIEQWDPSVLAARKLTPGRVVPGCAFELVVRSFGRRLPMDYRLIASTENRYLHLRGTGEGIVADDRIKLEPLEDGLTRIRYTADLQLARLAPWQGALLASSLRRMGRATVAGLQRALEGQRTLLPASPPAGTRERLLLPAAWAFTAHGYRKMADKGLSRFMNDRMVVITGPTGGIGLTAACELARLGARLVLIGRGADRLQQAAQTISNFAGTDPHAIIRIEADLTDPGQTARAIATTLDHAPRIDVLINNAGALFATRELTVDGHERSLAINLLAPYRLSTGLLPALEAANGRVLNVSSGGQYLQKLDFTDLAFERRKFEGSKAYAQAKRGLVSLTRSLARRHPHIGMHAMHPGWVDTPGIDRALPGFTRRLRPWLRDARMGADTLVWLASEDASRLPSGQFWLDRRCVPFDVRTDTVLSPADDERLLTWLAEHA